MPHLVKMLWGDVYTTVKPANSPAVKIKVIEHSLVAKRGKELIFFYEWQAVEDAMASIVESQVQTVVIECMGCCYPF